MVFNFHNLKPPTWFWAGVLIILAFCVVILTPMFNLIFGKGNKSQGAHGLESPDTVYVKLPYPESVNCKYDIVYVSSDAKAIRMLNKVEDGYIEGNDKK